jgi:prolyl-tRNA synthetase
MFSDGDLLGIPIRVIVSPRNLEDDCVEILTRDKKYHETVKRADVLLTLNEIIKKLEEEKD